jgi:N-[(2S)-2-amino-2-carboxyethyl]-L-glutamate dehydrogenase
VNELHYVTRDEVIRACAGVDVLEVVRDALVRHAAGRTVLPDEAYLGWTAPDGAAARSLAMPGALRGPDGELQLGLKVINGCLSNPDRGLARAQGVIMVFDPQTAWPVALLEAAHISSTRTAAVTAVTAAHLARPGASRLAVLGCGALARAHLRLLPTALPSLTEIALYDVERERAERLAADVGADVCSDPRACVDGADLVVTTTTSTRGYIDHDWLRPGALIAHVSLDDVLPSVVHNADLLVVDDWNLVSQDRRRLLGVLYRDGKLRSPSGEHHPESVPDPAARAVDTTIGDILAGRHPGRKSAEDIVLSNPFGMAILDVALAHAVLPIAIENGARRLPR